MTQKSDKLVRQKSASIAKLVPRDISENLGRLPPQALDLEEAVLGSLMLEKLAVQSVIDLLQPDDFYTEQHREIYQAITDLYTDMQPIDMRTIVARLRKNGRLEIVGGAHYIAELTSRVSSAANIAYHARLLQEYSIKRQIITVSSQAQQDAYEDMTDTFDMLDALQGKMDAIGGRYLKGNFLSASDLARKTFKSILDARNNGGLTGVPSGYRTLDRSLCGFKKTDLIIVAARPGMGKTAFVLSSAINNAKAGIPVGLFSLEMASEQLMNRAFSSETEIENTIITNNKCTDDELNRVAEAMKEISKMPLYIDDTPGISILELRARCRRLKHEKNVQLIIIDYLQLMKGDHQGNREQEIASISRALKGIAKELEIPVIALSQLSRGVESRGGDKRPQLSDLRDSGAIEQDADIVMFLYRPEYYKISQDSEGRSTKNVMDVDIAKNRNGALDSVPLKFIGRFTKVLDWDAPPEMSNAPMKAIARAQDPDVRAPYKDTDEAPF